MLRTLDVRHGLKTTDFIDKNLSLSEIQLICKSAESEYNLIFNSDKAVVYDIGIDLKLSRICAQQIRQSNAPIYCNLIDFGLIMQIENYFRVNSYQHLLIYSYHITVKRMI